MKTIAALFVPLFTLALLAPALRAQAGNEGMATGSSAQEDAGNDGSLFPDAAGPSDKPETTNDKPGGITRLFKGPKKGGPKTTVSTSDQIRLRKAKTQALTDPRLQQLWDEAEASRSDVEKRALLRSYYELLYGRMLKIDGSLAPLIKARKEASLAALSQSKLRPLGSDPKQP